MSTRTYLLNIRPLLLVLLAMLVASAHTAEAQTSSEQTVESRKSPWLAFGLSVLLVPGAGQAYNGQWGKGGLMLGGVVVSFWGRRSGRQRLRFIWIW